MTSDIASLNQVTHFQGSKKIKIGNGQGFPVKNLGYLLIHTPSHSLILKNVLHLPSIDVNLMSFP